ncbi:GrpB family protein [Dethiothermospora halolimnae]|uniref:GrpB family protein n=1 Tax=Dethiothermospora halolimnae TaxID=3114390 RepID=UPI003CCC0BC6
MTRRIIEVVPYDNTWKEKYNEEAEKIEKILGDKIINIYHIGSTAIPNMMAKPVIDIMVEVKNIEEIDNYDSGFNNIGYEAMGEHGIKNRRFYRKGKYNRTHHIHIFEKGNEEINKHLNFRDYMKAHPKLAKEYGELKSKLAREFKYDSEGYCNGKDSFIKEIDKKAYRWKNDM